MNQEQWHCKKKGCEANAWTNIDGRWECHYCRTIADFNPVVKDSLTPDPAPLGGPQEPTDLAKCAYHGDFKADDGCAVCISETETAGAMGDLGIRAPESSAKAPMVDPADVRMVSASVDLLNDSGTFAAWSRIKAVVEAPAAPVEGQGLEAVAEALREMAKRENPGKGSWRSIGSASKCHWMIQAQKIVDIASRPTPSTPEKAREA